MKKMFHLIHNMWNTLFHCHFNLHFFPTSKKIPNVLKNNAWQRCGKQALIHWLPGIEMGTTSMES